MKGDYSFNVQISEDGENWEDYEVLDFAVIDDAASSSLSSSSSGGCNFGFSAIGLCIALLMFAKTKTKK